MIRATYQFNDHFGLVLLLPFRVYKWKTNLVHLK